MSNTMKSQNHRLLANRILSVVLSIAMAWSSTPLPATAGSETSLSDQAGTASQETETVSKESSISLDTDASGSVQETSPKEKDQKQTSSSSTATTGASSEAAPKSADVALNLDHAYLTYKDQKVALPAKKISLPTDKDFSFTVTPDTGYELVEVYTSYNSKPVNDANKQVLKPDDKGVYKVSPSAVAEGITLTVTTQEAPSQEDQKSDVTAIDADQEESTSDQTADDVEDEDADSQADAEAQDDSQTKGEADLESDEEPDGSDVQDSTEEQESIEDAAQDQEAQEETPATKTTYTYEDDQVSVTAVLQDPEAVPDDAQFKVTPVTQTVSGYNYEAYMDALNGGLSEDQAYTADNTLLYDVAFMVPKEDADGKVIQGEWEEYEPTEGSVTITFNFKQSQLTEDLDAQASDEVEVKHLPLSNAARAQVDSTAEATGISAKDVRVEDLSASVSTQGTQSVSLTTSDLSVMAVSKRKAASTFAIKDATDGKLSLEDIMGNARYYGIVADEWYLVEAETNAAVKTIYANGSQSGNDMTSGDDAQPWVIGDIKGYTTNVISWWPYKAETVINDNPNPFQFKGRQVNAYVTQHVYDVLHDYNNNKNANYKIISQSTANSYVEGMESALRSTSATMATKSSVQGTLPAVGSDGNHQLTNYVLDFSDKPAGTYYVNLDSVIDQLSQQASGLKIRKKSDQTIVLNVTKSGTVNLQKFEVSTDGGGYVGSDQTTAAGEAIAKSIVWNVPNATTLNTSGSILGMILAPNATFNLTSTSAGWLYAKTVMSGSGEWHQIWQSFNQDYPKPDNPTPTTKTISVKVDKVWVGPAGQSVTVHLYANGQDTGKTLTLDAGKGWSGTFDNLPEKDNQGKKISYTITEDPVEGYTGAITGSAKKGYTVTNTATQTVSVAGTKTWDDQDNADGIRPSEVWINLWADGNYVTSYRMTEADGWRYHFDNLPKYDATDGHQINYAVYETVPDGYEASFNGYDVTNRHTPQKTSVSVNKQWVGPAAGPVTVRLYANGQDTGKTLTLSEANGWAGTFTDLNQKTGGQDIAYTVAEDAVAGYSSKVTGSATAGYTITNTNTETTSIAGTKTWDDQNDRDGIRPSEVWINLRADGQWVTSYKMTEADGWRYHFDNLPKYSATDGHQIAYTVDETVPAGYEATFNGYDVTNTHRPATTSLTVRKEWVGPVSSAGSVVVRLLANGKSTNWTATITAAGPDLILGTADDWTASFQGLPANEGGRAIEYTVSEEAVANYDATITGSMGAGYTVTNTNTETTAIKVSKAWEDDNNRDGIRPGSVQVQLYANGQVVQGQTLTLGEANKWSGAFYGLAKYASDGKAIAYTVRELGVPQGYETSLTGDAASGFTVTNRHETQKTSVPVSKSWVGPAAGPVTVRLYADGADTGRTLELSADNGWAGSFDDLPANEGGRAIAYTVSEDAVPQGYESSVTGSAAAGFTVTNTNTETTSVSGTKTWVDDGDRDGVRPQAVTVRLWADGEEVASREVSASDNWAFSFDGLARYAADGHEVSYSVTEDAVPGYETSYDGYYVTNRHETQKTSVPVSKSWVGPAAGPVTVRLYADGADTGRTLELSADNGWAGSFDDLPANEGGRAIAYTVSEDAVPQGYESSVTGSAAAGFTVTNTNTETTSVSGTKTWVDDGDRDGVRPQAVTVRLWADGEEVASREVSASDNWAFSFDGLARYAADGHEVSYSVTEDAVPGYETSYDGYYVTNTYAPEKTSVSVTKAWDDANDQDGVRPDAVTVQLYADGQAYGDPVTLSDEAGWTHTWSDLYRKAQGKDIAYTVQELNVPEGYTVAATGDAGKGFTLTNSHQTETTQVSVSKAWEDDNNRDGLRPASVKVQLYANGQAYGDPVDLTEANGWTTTWSGLAKNAKGQPIAYTIRELDVPQGYESSVTGDAASGFTVTNRHETQKTSVSVSKRWVGPAAGPVTVRLLADGADTGRTLELSADNGWAGSFDDLPANAAGKPIAYTVQELDVPQGYVAAVTGSATAGFTVTNTNVEKTSVQVAKAWEDANNQDGLRPAAIRIQLYADGSAQGDPVDLSDANSWAATFSDLAKYAADGHQVVYTVRELDVPEGYESTVSGDAASGFTVTNRHETQKTSVPVAKYWVGPVPETVSSVTVHLLADGADTGRTLELSEANGWKGTFENLDVKASGREITYTVAEDASPDGSYSGVIAGTASAGFSITNTNTQKTSVQVSKAWEDDGNRDGLRPAAIRVQLYADGSAQGDPVDLSDANSWAATFSDLAKYAADGHQVVYTVRELDVPEGYESTVFGDAASGFTVTNRHETQKTSVPVSKSWVGPAAGPVTVRLLADGADTGRSLTLSADNGWAGSFDDLPANKGGRAIAYTVSEDAVANYEAAITGSAEAGYTITNTNVEKTAVSGNKIWADDNDRDGVRPQAITVRLLADGQEVQAQTVTGPTWSYTFTNLPKYDRTTGKAISYTVTEDAAPGYATIVDGTNLVNTHQVQKTSVQVTKAWDDANDQDGVRPDAVTVQLYANGTAVAGKTLTLSADNQWTGTFKDLPVNATGKPIAYTVQELDVPEGYTVATTGDASQGFTLTNSHQTETTQVSVTKRWDDANNQDGVRPSAEDLAARLRLTSDVQGLDLSAYTPTVTDNGDDTYTVTYSGMPKYQVGGTQVTYTVTEAQDAFVAQGYQAQVASAQDGQTLVNHHDTATTSVSITKVWSDSNNQDGVRPSAEDFARSVSLTSSLEGQDLSAYQPIVTDKGDGTYTVTYEGLPKFQQGGTQVTYTIVEDAIPGYEAVDGVVSATDGGSIANGHQIQTIDIPVSKVWDDQDNQDGRRPSSIQVQLYADGQPVEGQVLTLTAAGDDGQEGTEDDWKGSFTTLSRYRDQGTEVQYTVQEVARVEGYESSVTGSAADGFTITNAHQVEKTKVDVTKAWEGPIRDEATIRLYANGQDTGKTLTLSADTDWKASFEDLDVYQGGQPITYTVQEDPVPTAYTAQVSGEAGTGFTITNTYAATGTAQVQARKDLLGGSLAAGQFSFSLYPADADGQVTGDAIQSGVTNAADGIVSFAPLSYTERDLKDADGGYNQTATAHYVIREDVPEDAVLVDEDTYLKDGVLYDAHDELVEVALTDDGAGTINTAVTYPKAAGDTAYQPTFTNSLAARAQLSLAKEAYTTDVTPSYTFQMVSSDDQGNPTGSVATGYVEGTAFVDDGVQPISDTVSGLGTLSFHEITYTKEGTYHYLLTEVGVNDAGSDTVQYLATVQVTKDQAGALVASAPSYLYRQDEGASWEALPDDQTPTFYNNYQVSMAYRRLALAANRRRAERVSVTPTARKLLDGKADMKAGQFSFGLYEVDGEGKVAGEPVQVAQNASDGTVAFAPLSFSEVGTHTYVIRELPGKDASLNYDQAEYNYTVKVTQGQDQALHAEATYGTDDGQAPTFTNTTKTIKIRMRKVSKGSDGIPTDEGLYNAQYGLWQVGQNGAEDVYLGNQRSDQGGYIVFDVPITQGRIYYFKEEIAPEGHLVDPYPTTKFYIVKDEATGRYRMELAS